MPLDERDRNERNKVQGCASQVWLSTRVAPDGEGGPMLDIRRRQRRPHREGADRDPVRDLFRPAAKEILATDAVELFNRLGLREHLTPQRSNGFRSMVDRIRTDARAALTPP